jgi:hypothetical protein
MAWNIHSLVFVWSHHLLNDPEIWGGVIFSMILKSGHIYRRITEIGMEGFSGVRIVMDTKYIPSFIFYVLTSYAYHILGAA